MEGFADVSKARAAWKVYVEALAAGREIMRRAGVENPPPIPDFDAVFRRMSPDLRQELYAALDSRPWQTPADAIQLWQPFIKKAFQA